MNHLIARQRNSDGRWDYTRNGRPTGYCRAYEPIPEDAGFMSPEAIRAENERMAAFSGKFHEDGHATKEEACECYKEFLLDTHSHFPAKEPEQASQQFKCQVCGAWTACTAQVGAYGLFFVCPEHCTREHVAELMRISTAVAKS